MSRRFRLLRAVVVAVACLGLTGFPVMAQSCDNYCYCYCQGISSYGCLTTSGGYCCTCCCVCNTKTCKYTCTTSCCVKNCCKKSECYKNCCFLQSHYYTCSSSCYSCQSSGCCSYTCSGNYSGPA